MSKRNKINKNGGGNGRNGKMRQKGAGESEEVVVNAIKHQRRAAYEEYHLKGVPNQDQRLHDLAVVALQAIYSMPKVLLSFVHKQVSKNLHISQEQCMERFLMEDQKMVKYLPCAAQPSPSPIPPLTAFN